MPSRAKKPLALLLTHSGDFFGIDRVARALRRLGWNALRFDTDTFPAEASLTVERRSEGVDGVLELQRHRVRLSEVRAVWLRRFWPPVLPQSMTPEDRAACAEASWVSLRDALVHLTRCRWVNGFEASERAESKVLQFRLAQRLGLALPDTVLTNSPAAVERFHADYPRVVTKLVTPLTQAMQTERFVYTSELKEDDFRSLDGLRWAPQIFQPLIEKARELRVVIVGDETFVGALEVQGVTDWRQLPRGAAKWQRAELPRAVEVRSRRLLRELGLISGVLDYIITPEERCVFLEVNPAGEWGWLEEDLGFDISGAFARALVSRVTP